MSDPTDVPLYYSSKRDENGLPIYRCIRGTNSLEGGVHQNIIRFFGSVNADIRTAHCMLGIYRHFHNTRVGYENRTGKAYQHHYDLLLDARTFQMYEQLGWEEHIPDIVISLMRLLSLSTHFPDRYDLTLHGCTRNVLVSTLASTQYPDMYWIFLIYHRTRSLWVGR